jgi:hypothetical protein
VAAALGRHWHRDDQRQGRALISDELDTLFATPPAAFIEERKRIVAALKAAGRKDEAKTVEKIPRPSLAVWTVNRIAQLDPDLVRQLGAITDRLASAAGAEYAAAAAEHRQTLAALRRRAAEVLGAAGQEAGLNLVQRVIANLRAAVGSAETRATLEHGRLERDVEEQDVTSLFGAAVAAGAAAPGKPSATKETKAAKSDEKSAAEAKALARARAKEIATAEREVKRLREAAAAARKNVERSERAVAAAQEALADAEKKLADDKEARDAAAHELGEAEATLAGLTED